MRRSKIFPRAEKGKTMIVSEYIKGLKNNYVRIRELSLPDERKYQYCIMKRGGISGFLPFEIRYIDTDAYMYYDITSKQNISTLYSKKPLDRKWIGDFYAAMKKVKNEAVRFLLDPSNIIWNPSNVYRDLTSGQFSFLYVPYLDDNNGMSEMMDFILEHVDYSDEELVKCIYSVAEQYKTSGDIYLSEKVFLDIEGIKIDPENTDVSVSDDVMEKDPEMKDVPENTDKNDRTLDDIYENAEKIGNGFKGIGERPLHLKPTAKDNDKKKRQQNVGKSMGLFSFIKRAKERDAFLRDEYGYGNELEGMGAVAEELLYSDRENEDSQEGTLYLDISEEEKKIRMESETGALLYVFDGDSCIIGKKEAEADLVIDDAGVSRMHARVFLKDGDYYLEDLNSTNGTFKNGLKLKPYEQKKLERGDEIKIATRRIFFR